MMDNRYRILPRTGCVLLAALLALSGCGDDDDDNVVAAASPPLTGVFVDAEVGGLAWQALPSGLGGTTGADGVFHYRPGDTVSFSLGAVRLGAAPGAAQITPRTLAEAEDENALPVGVTAADIAANIARFLQSFDSDGNPDNGISIPAAVAAAATSAIDFAQPAATFGSDATFLQLATDSGVEPVSAAQAAAHSTRSVLKQLAGTWVWRDPGAPQNLLQLTFFTDQTFVKGGYEAGSTCAGGSADGAEWGSFEYHAASGILTPTGTRTDTDGECGLYTAEPDTVQGVYRLTLDGDSLLVEEIENEQVVGTFTMARVAAGAGIVGSWLFRDGVDGGMPEIVSFFADGTYVYVGWPDAADETVAGTEVGSWSRAADGALTVSNLVADANGAGGFSAPSGTMVTTIGNDGLLQYVEGGAPARHYPRFPLAEKLDAAGLAGAWYVEDPLAPLASAAASNLFVVFLPDGTYIMGTHDDDPACDADYGNADPLPGDSLDPDGNGSEIAEWLLDTGTGQLTASGATLDSNGSCGLYNALYAGHALGNTLVIDEVVDADTLSATAHDIDVGGVTTSAITLRRLPATAGSLEGAWMQEGGGDVLIFFADGTDFVIDADEGGGIQRGTHSLNVERTVLTMSSDGSDPLCVDTIGSGSDCAIFPVEVNPFPVVINAATTVMTLDGAVFRKID